MNFSLSRSQSDRRRVIEFGAGHLARADFVTDRFDNLELTNLEFADQPAGAAAEAGWPPEIAATLASLLPPRSSGVGPTVVLPGHLVLAKTLRIAGGGAGASASAIEFEVQQNLPFDLGDVVWDHRPQGPAGADGEQEILVAAVRCADLAELDPAWRSAGCVPGRILPAGLAVERVWRSQHEGETAPAMIVSIGARSTHLIFLEGTRTHLRTLSLAGNTVTRQIAATVEQTPAEAESLKLNVLGRGLELPPDSPAGRAVAQAVDAFENRLGLEITRSIVNLQHQQRMAAPAKAWLTGGGAGIAGLAECLGARLKLPIERLDPLVGIAVGAGAQAAVQRLGVDRLTEVIGAALPPVAGEIELNLLPADLQAEHARGRRTPRYFAAAALLAVALALPGVHFQRLATARMERERELTRELTPLYDYRARNEANLVRWEELRSEIEALGAAVEARDQWRGLLGDLQHRMVDVGDVWLERMQVIRTPTAAGPMRYDDFGDPIMPPPEPVRLRLSGRLLDRANPMSRVSQGSYERVTSLLSSFTDSQFVAAVEGERFDAGDPGILRFDFTLVLAAEAVL